MPLPNWPGYMWTGPVGAGGQAAGHGVLSHSANCEYREGTMHNGRQQGRWIEQCRDGKWRSRQYSIWDSVCQPSQPDQVRLVAPRPCPQWDCGPLVQF